jgi:hypothetical protein
MAEMKKYFQRTPDGTILNLFFIKKRLRQLGVFVRDVDEIKHAGKLVYEVILELETVMNTELLDADRKKLQRFEKELDEFLKEIKLDTDVIVQFANDCLIFLIEGGLAYLIQ